MCYLRDVKQPARGRDSDGNGREKKTKVKTIQKRLRRQQFSSQDFFLLVSVLRFDFNFHGFIFSKQGYFFGNHLRCLASGSFTRSRNGRSYTKSDEILVEKGKTFFKKKTMKVLNLSKHSNITKSFRKN